MSCVENVVLRKECECDYNVCSDSVTPKACMHYPWEYECVDVTTDGFGPIIGCAANLETGTAVELAYHSMCNGGKIEILPDCSSDELCVKSEINPKICVVAKDKFCLCGDTGIK